MAEGSDRERLGTSTVASELRGGQLHPAGQVQRVLIVDDNQEICMLLLECIADLGLLGDHAPDVETATRLIEQRPYDLIVLDLILPGQSGLDLLQTMRLGDSKARVIMITGSGDLRSATQAIRMTVDDYLLKPFKLSEFQESVLRSLRICRKIREGQMAQRTLLQRSEGLEQQLKDQSYGGVLSLVRIIELRDPCTEGHSHRVAGLSLDLARSAGLECSDVELGFGAILHDVGKIALPRALLKKPGPLTDDEMADIRRHPQQGAEILSPLFGRGTVYRCALGHHERWDGRGYPDGRRGEETSIEERIISLCDAYDAMTSDRPYRRALSSAKALNVIRLGAGSQFDPNLAKLFCRDAHTYSGVTNNRMP